MSYPLFHSGGGESWQNVLSSILVVEKADRMSCPPFWWWERLTECLALHSGGRKSWLRISCSPFWWWIKLTESECLVHHSGGGKGRHSVLSTRQADRMSCPQDKLIKCLVPQMRTEHHLVLCAYDIHTYIYNIDILAGGNQRDVEEFSVAVFATHCWLHHSSWTLTRHCIIGMQWWGRVRQHCSCGCCRCIQLR